ncbi:MAG: hypothetical protein NTY50_12310 [Methylobacter sp.]|nr:hypothetical protein [Methylobacter sp.]
MNKWYIAFLNNPNQAVADLFSGRAGLGSNLRLDIPELLYQEFPTHLNSPSHGNSSIMPCCIG